MQTSVWRNLVREGEESDQEGSSWPRVSVKGSKREQQNKPGAGRRESVDKEKLQIQKKGKQSEESKRRP